MSHLHTMLAHTTLGLAMAAALAAPAFAQDHTTPAANRALQKQEIASGDPARWYQDDATREAQLRTLRKEIGAALQEANVACKKMAPGERAGCMKDARATYQQDMANANQIRDNNHQVQ